MTEERISPLRARMIEDRIARTFRQENIKLPKRIGKAGINFAAATPWLIGRMLKDPVYAGACAFGRTTCEVILDQGRKRMVKQRRAHPEEWDVLLQDHHEAFITWPEYLQNLETLMHNRNQLGAAVRGAARDGKGLLAGLVRCSSCGKKMRVRYASRSRGDSAAVYYQCTASQQATDGLPVGKQLCSQFGGITVEQAVAEAVLAALAPVRIEALTRATERLADARAEKRQHLEMEIERACFEAERLRRQYDAAEPENRLVARTLEHRWNEALAHVDRLQETLVGQLARLMADKQIAAQLNRMGIRTGKGHTWTRARVGNFRGDNQIAIYTPGERKARNELTIEETAQKLGVSYSTVQRMIKRRQLLGSQICLGAPWIIRCQDVEALQSGAKLDLAPQKTPSPPLSGQQTLAFS